MKNAVQLICYADRLGGTMHGLRELLAGPFAGLFGGVHVLPFFHPIDGTDAGFDPIDHTQVDPRLGSWQDVQALAGEVEVMADVIVNHMSCRSPQFLDYAAHGGNSRYDGMFLTLDSVFPRWCLRTGPAGHLPAAPRLALHCHDAGRWHAAHPVDHVHQRTGGHRRAASRGHALPGFHPRPCSSRHGVRMIRLDAVGYAIKKAGQQLLHDGRRPSGSSASSRRAPARAASKCWWRSTRTTSSRCASRSQVDCVYDFALPPLVLHAFFAGHGAAPEALDRRPPRECIDRAGYARWHRRHRCRRGRRGSRQLIRACCPRPTSTRWWRPSTATAVAKACVPPVPRPRTSTCTR